MKKLIFSSNNEKNRVLKLLPETDPSDLLRLRDGIYAADLLVTAISHLDFFSEVNKHHLDIEGICKYFSIDKRCTDVMLTYYLSLGLISTDNGVYSTTTKANEFLLSTSNRNLIP
ncbi:MAG TPA: hypothetical protein VHO50_10765 [Bacteroidales bacterium]|nr:hypothetical protein [Bacteroidales bacterium]